MTGAGEFSGTIAGGTYRLVRALEGGDGHVHEARHDRLAGRFALKLFGDVEPRAFERAAQRSAALRHPGIGKVVDYGGAPDRAFVVMEWIEGRSLTALLGDDGVVPADRVARLVDSIALGLQAAHRQGLAHGHLDPGRIFVLGPGGDDDETPGAERTKIVGFGLGDDLAPGPQITEETPYMAPEQLAGEARPLADQFALAAIVYELLTGVPPSADGDERQPPRSIREYAPDVNVIVDDVVQRALLPDPEARWADVYTFAKRLREAVDAGGEREEKTRLAPLPLTVTRHPSPPSPAAFGTPAATAPLDPFASTVVFTPGPIDVPVIASEDVDLHTPAPRRLESPTSGGPSMHQPPRPYSDPYSNPPPNRIAPPRGSAPARPYAIRPTPTFSFADEPVAGPSWKPARRRSGGGLGLAVLVVAAGLGGYFAVQYRAWQDLGPLLARAKELASSLKTLSPSTSRELPATPSPTTSSAPSAAGDDTSATTAPAAAKPAAAPTVMHPEVVPIEATPAPKSRSTSRSASRAAAKPESVTAAATTAPMKDTASRPTAAASPPHHPGHAHGGRPRKEAFDEAAAEEALLGGP